jgi:RsiW-degrading membrane proteinase PrsW (M82 family)
VAGVSPPPPLSQPTAASAPAGVSPYGPYQPYTGTTPTAATRQPYPPVYPPYPPYPPVYTTGYPPYPSAYPPGQPGQPSSQGASRYHAPQSYAPYPYPYPPQPGQQTQQTTTHAPGHPLYAQGQAVAGYSYPAYPYPQPYWAYPYPVVIAPGRPSGEIYALVVSWIIFGLGILSIIGGLLLFLLAAVATARGAGDSLAVLTTFAGYSLGPILGGILAIVYSISRVMKRPSPPPSLPPALAMLALTIVALGSAVVLWHFYPSPGLAFAVLPLALLSGFLPALTILAYGVQRLGATTTRRRLWLSLFFGATMAPLFAIILEGIAALLLAIGLRVLLPGTTPSTGIDTVPQTLADVLFTLIFTAVVAPVVEEGLKPLGAVLIMRRLSSPAEAFLLGLAAGIGFDMVETIGYIGTGQADWISVAILRIGAGLLHGLGAAMGALGWYYLINGKDVRRRWLKGFGGLGYAVLQHGIFNGSNLLGLVPGPIGDLMSKTLYLGRLPLDSGTILFFGYYIIILGVLVYMIGRLRRKAATPAGTAPATPPAPLLPSGAAPQPVSGGVRS